MEPHMISTAGVLPLDFHRVNVGERIQRRTEALVEHLSNAGEEAIERRLRTLDTEWDVDRAHEFQVGALAAIGIASSLTGKKKWLILPAVTAALQLASSLTGVSPAFALLRSLGYRTPNEIDREHFALKAIRGDFRRLSATLDVLSRLMTTM